MDYDSADSAVSDVDDDEVEEDVFDGGEGESRRKERQRQEENVEHSNPFSLSWAAMRLAVLRLVQLQMQDFLNIAGIELQGWP